MNIQQIFPSFLAIEKLDLNNTMISEYIRWMQQDNLGRVISNVNGWQSNPLDLSSTPEFLSPLVDEVLLRANFLHRYYQLSDFYNQTIINYWINVNGPGSYNLAHTHAGGVFSAVYYVEVPEGSGDIEFMHPVPGHEYTIKEEYIGQLNDFNGGLVKLSPKAGDLVIFPAWLQHFVRMNNSNRDRISIAFDTKIVPA
jgi:uncharacterized protein (TIGR02466 family)